MLLRITQITRTNWVTA